jgi:hypothetical protein
LWQNEVESMICSQRCRSFRLFAAIAIGFALLLLLVPHQQTPLDTPLLAMLPVFFIGLIAPLSLGSRAPSLDIRHIPGAPLLRKSFQRPPPFQFA